MIEVRNQVPDYYYSESRDFQLLGRIFEGVFNYYKTAADNLENVPLSQNLDVSLLDLITKTVGFDSRNKYGSKNLLTVANSFKHLLKIKGTKKSIEDAVKLLLKAQNLDTQSSVIIEGNVEKEDGNGDIYVDYVKNIIIYIPEPLKDTALLEDVLEYVLPIGFDFKIVTGKFAQDVPELLSTATSSATISLKQTSTRLGSITPGLVTINSDEIDKDLRATNAQIGLIDNTVIVWDSDEGDEVDEASKQNENEEHQEE